MTVIDNPIRAHGPEQISPKKEKRLRNVARATSKRAIRVTNVSTEDSYVDVLHYGAKNTTCNDGHCMTRVHPQVKRIQSVDLERVVDDAKSFFDDYYSFLNEFRSIDHIERLEDAMLSLSIRGFYELTQEELVFGVRSAWRNDPTSLARVDWENLRVMDYRHVSTVKEMFEALCEHIVKSTNDGRIVPTASVFRERRRDEIDFRVWNQQLIGYAGYEQEDGSVVGDPENIQFTQLCIQLGWVGKGTRFDILPLVLSSATEDPQWFNLPTELVSIVKIEHPSYPWFAKQGLEWPSLKSESDKLLNIGGIQFPNASLTHSHLGCDVGNSLTTLNGRNLFQIIANQMHLDTSVLSTLWQETAEVELNVAILCSFKNQNVTITDHHSASRRFLQFFEEEQLMRGGCPSDWAKVVPTLNSGITPIYHQEMVRYELTPNMAPQLPAWKNYKWLDATKQPNNFKGNSKRCLSFRTLARIVTWMMKPIMNRVRVSIVYASETGRSESFAEKLTALFSRVFRVELVPMNEYKTNSVGQREKLLLVVASTFGNGNSPENGKKFHKTMKDLCAIDVNNNQTNFEFAFDFESVMRLKFAVFALGSSTYPDFCEFGSFCHDSLLTLGAQSIIPLTKADEVRGQEKIFTSWASKVFRSACSEFNLGEQDSHLPPEISSPTIWKPTLYRLNSTSEQTEVDLCSAMSKIHNRQLFSYHLNDRYNLHQSDSSRSTFFLQFNNVDGAQEHQPGDHVAIFPSNSDSIVSPFIDRLRIPDKHEVRKIQRRDSTDGEWHTIDRFPPCSAQTALTYFVDICAAPQQHLLAQLAQFASEDIERKQLDLLANDEDAYDIWKEENCPTLLDVFTQFPSLKVDLTFLLLRLPLIQPRFYSISNSWAMAKNEIHLTVGLDVFRDGLRHGLCSSFLNEMPVGENVVGYVKKAEHFHLPSTSSPVLMIGAGTGLAPFRSFWQHKIVDKTSSELKLYFGCRHPRVDYLYHDEIRRLHQDGDLSVVRSAFSRLDNLKKTYVQHLLQQDEVSIWRHLCDGGHVYVCGSSNMASEVRSVLQNIIKNQGQMTDAQANDYLLQLKETGKIHEDIFGVAVTRS